MADHETLLGLAGRVPDDVLADARLRLADGTPAGAVEPVFAAEVAYAFTPATGTAVPPLLDLVGGELDRADQAAATAAARLPGAAALWRAWRSAPAWEPPGTAPTRVYLLEADVPPATLPAATAGLMRDLSAAGVAAPQVETYRPGSDLPSYQQAARGGSALLWTAGETPPVRLARVFDRGGAEGPGFDPAHERLEDAERDRVAQFLAAGEPILVTTKTAGDIVEPERGPVVPLSFRTDGHWVWTDTVTYYLRQYSLAPDRELLDHIRVRDYVVAEVDAAGEHRTLATLLART
jgi:hypothetical protein